MAMVEKPTERTYATELVAVIKEKKDLGFDTEVEERLSCLDFIVRLTITLTLGFDRSS